jgi:adhesin/invasin
VSLSADGNTAIVGGPVDNSSAGAAWVFISSASATQVAFVLQPTNAAAGQSITPAVTVQLENSGGSPVAQGGVTITMSLSSGTGTLGGTLSQVTDGSGLATFNNLWINLIGSKQLTAASAGLTSAVSSTFTIAAAAAVNILATGGTPRSAPISTQFGQPLLVTVTDSFGNPVAGAVVTYSAPGSGPSASLSNGGSATTDASGHASVTATANGIVGGPYLVSATTGTLEPGTFSLTNLQVQAAAAAQIPVLDGFGLALLAALLAAVAFNVLGRQ